MMVRRVLSIGASLSLLVIAACDSGPSGPGSLIGRVTGESLGGVVLEVTGAGIRGFEGRGNTQAYAAPMAGRENMHRVLLIDPQGGEILFEILVDDVGMDDPVMVVVSAAGTDNLTQMAASIDVRVER
jgi:hypothetical protein